jgi:hypothetical protein
LDSLTSKERCSNSISNLQSDIKLFHLLLYNICLVQSLLEIINQGLKRIPITH